MTAVPEISWIADTGQADWVIERLRSGHRWCVDRIVPHGYESYARILHPAWADEPLGTAVRWSEVAAQTHRVMHPLVQFGAIARPAEGAGGWDGQPPLMSLSESQVQVLIELLSKATSTPQRCWFCLWDGYGWLYSGGRPVPRMIHVPGTRMRLHFPSRSPRGLISSVIPPAALDYPLVRAPLRDYRLYQGHISTAAAFFGAPLRADQSPNLWWPTGRAWCVGTDIDLQSTYLGGSQQLVSAVLDDARLEAFPAQPTDPVTRDSDEINTPAGTGDS